MSQHLSASILVVVGMISVGFATPVQAMHDGLLHEYTQAACQAETGTCKPGGNSCLVGPQGEDLLGYCDGPTNAVSCCKLKPTATAPNTQFNCTNVLRGTCKLVSVGCGAGITPLAPGSSCGVDAAGIGRICCPIPAPVTAPTQVTGPNLGNYQLLEQIPGSTNTVGSLKTYLEDMYRFAFWTVGIAVVLMLTVGGFMYMTSAGNTSRMSTAKTVIFDAILGLILALMAWLFLYVINPDLVNLTLPTGVTVTPGT